MAEEPGKTFPVKHPWRSLSGVLFVQAQNAFNDNFLKIILISLAAAVARGQWLGDNAQRLLSSFIPLAFLLLSPLAGFLSDRYSKRSVLFWTVVAQLFIFVVTIVSLKIENLWLAVVCLFLLSAQSTFFSPAKQGILKELVGSRKLTFANGILQMLSMLAILAGIYFGGNWFGNLVQSGKGAWGAASIPVLAVSMVAMVPLFMNLVVDKTPAHISASFEASILWRHFLYLKELFAGKSMARSALGISFYWLFATFVGVVLFDFGQLLHPDDVGGAAKEASKIYALIGVGLMLGSILVSFISRNSVNLKLVPIGGLGLILGMLATGLFTAGNIGFYGGMTTIGFFGGFFLVPLSSYLQDVAPNAQRGRIIGATAVLNSITSLLAIVISVIFTQMSLKPSHQMLCFVIPMALVTWYVSSLNSTQKVATSEIS